MSPAQELSLLLEAVADVDLDTIWRVIDEHQFTDHSAGDGYQEPREHWINCTCDATVWDWQQYYMETAEDPETNKKMHLIMMVVDAVLNEGKPNKEEA